MSVGLTTGNSNLLKIKYRDRWIEAIKRHEGQFNKMPIIAGNTDRYEWPMEMQGITSLGNAAEGQAFPTPDAPQVIRPYVGYKVFHAAVQLTDVIRALAKGDAGSFRSASDHLVKSAVSQSMRYREFTHYLDGTGIVGVLAGTVTSGTTALTVNGYDAVVATRTTDRTSINAGVWPSATYEIYDQTTLTSKGTVTIANQNDPTSSGTLGAFTLASPGFPAGCATGDLLVWRGAYGLGYDGLNSLIDNDVSGTFQNVNFTSNPIAKAWISTVLANGGTLRTLTPSLFIRALQGGFEKMGNSGDSGYSADRLEVLANPALAEQFMNMYQVTGAAANSVGTSSASATTPVAQGSLVRLTPESTKVGNSAMAMTTPFGDVKVNMKNNCPQQQVFGVDYSQTAFIQSRALDWREGVANMFNPSQVAAVYTAQLYEVGQPCVFDRRGMFKISDITTVAGNSGN